MFVDSPNHTVFNSHMSTSVMLSTNSEYGAVMLIRISLSKDVTKGSNHVSLLLDYHDHLPHHTVLNSHSIDHPVDLTSTQVHQSYGHWMLNEGINAWPIFHYHWKSKLMFNLFGMLLATRH